MRTFLALLLVTALIPACGGPGGRDDDDSIFIGGEVPVGALVITEIHAHPNVGRPEFIEVKNTSDSTIDLLGCQVADGGQSAHDFAIAVSVELAPGALALLGAAESLGAAEGELPVDVVWQDISLNQGDSTETVALYCPDGVGARQSIDQVAVDWSGFGLRRGHSWQLAGEADADLNDDPTAWCEAPVQDDSVFATVDDVPSYGTPGADTICETPGGPTPSSAGELVISELLIGEFTGLREWFELYNPGEEALDIRGCQLGDAEVGGGEPNTHTLDHERGDTVVPAGGVLLLSKTDLDITGDGSLLGQYPYSGLTFNNSGNQQLWLDCPLGNELVRIDEVLYNWEPYSSGFRGRSYTLSGLTLDAEANDLPENWCLAGDEDLYFSTTIDGDPPEDFDAYGTPGVVNPPCPEPGPTPGPGDLVISELLIADFGGLREWMELYNPGEEDLDMAGCVLGDEPVDQSSGPNLHELSFAAGETVVRAGGYLLLAKTALDVTSDGAVLADYAYTSLSFNNSADQRLWLECSGGEGVQVVDEITYNWSDYGSDFQGRSLALSVDFLNATDNDGPDHWCLAEDGDIYFSVEDGGEPPEMLQARGTPGLANKVCPVPDPFPQPGDLVITEIFGHSVPALGTNEEWFELMNVSAAPLGLDGCTIRDDSGDGSPDEHVINSVFGYSVAAGARSVLVKSSADDTIACGLAADYEYSTSIGFLNSSPETLSLLCPDPSGVLQLIDAVSYDGQFEPGFPWQLAPGFEDTTANDDPSNWCTNTDPLAYSWSCGVEPDANHGSPFGPAICP